MDLLHTVVAALLTLGVLITVHEYGHFWVARRCGVRVERFSIGFGPALYTWHDARNTEFVLALIPLGGYVKMLDAREGQVPPGAESEEFTAKPVSARIAIVAAGPLANFILAVVVFWGMYVIGVEGIAPIVDNVKPNTLAAQTSLTAGHEIVAIDDKPTPTVQILYETLAERMGDTGTIKVTSRVPGEAREFSHEVAVAAWLSDKSEPDPVVDLGINLWRPPVEPRVGALTPGLPAQQAGVLVGDLVLAVDGVAIATWGALVDYVRERPGSAILLTLEREGRVLNLSLVPTTTRLEDGRNVGQVGIIVKQPEWPAELIRSEHYGPAQAILPALLKTWETASGTLDNLRKMLVGLLSPKNLSGPITIAKVASASAKTGVAKYLALLGVLSVSLAVLNLLPIPVLDGGHLLFYTIEWLKGSALSEQAQLIGVKIGMALVLSVMLFAIYNDLTRL